MATRVTLWAGGLGVVWGLFITAVVPAYGEDAGFDVNPWIEDLHEIRAGMLEKYANFDWAVFEREVSLSELFEATEHRLRGATSAENAEAIIDRALRSIGDGHLRVRWPVVTPGVGMSSGAQGAASGDQGVASGTQGAAAAAADVCDAPGYDVVMRGHAVGPYIPGYRPLTDEVAAEFPAGVVDAGSRRIGVLRVGLFAPQGYPELCARVRDRLGIAAQSQCDESCVNRLEAAEYDVMSQDLEQRIRELERLGAVVLLVDVTGNGGGSEWAEAVARMVSPTKLRSERRDGVRGEHWAGYWVSVARQLREARPSASPAESRQLEDWARQVEQVESNAGAPCSALPFWSGHRPDCEWLAPAFYATGILAAADAASLHGKPWGPLVFSPAQYHFHESAWHGPLLVLVDGGTGSAAEEFSAVLQDNKAAIIVGAPTAGAGCGHTNGGTPVTLTHSHGVLELPDCTRIRRDGTNEVRGIDPDILIGFRATDGLHRKGLRTAPVFSTGVAAAVRLCEREKCDSKQPRH